MQVILLHCKCFIFSLPYRRLGGDRSALTCRNLTQAGNHFLLQFLKIIDNWIYSSSHLCIASLYSLHQFSHPGIIPHLFHSVSSIHCDPPFGSRAVRIAALLLRLL